MRTLRWISIALVGLLGLAIWSVRHPWRLPTAQPGLAPLIPLHDDQHAVLLLVEASALASNEPRRLEDRRHELEWLNVLQQRFGGCDVIDVAALPSVGAALLADRMLVVVPQPLSSDMDSTLAPLFDAAVLAGSDILLEAATGFWSRRLGLPARDREIRSHLPWPSSAPAARRAESTIGDPHPIPLRYRVRNYWPRAGELGLARALPSPSGRALGFQLEMGRGRWLLLALEFAELSQRLRQGSPSSDLRLRVRHATATQSSPSTMDLVSITELLQSDAAWLDRWIDALLESEFGSSPWPRLWPASFDADGFLLLTHDERSAQTDVDWIAKAEAAAGLSSTTFFAAGRDSTQHATPDIELDATREIAALSYWPGAANWHEPSAPRRLYGVGRFRPWGRLPGVQAQQQWLRQRAPRAALRAHRSFDGIWDAEVDQPLTALAAAGVELDLSFGPRGNAAGWLFGSAMPFRPLAVDGRMHRLHELPLLAIDQEGGLDAARLRRWLRHNAEGGHGPITLLFHPDSYAHSPSAELFELWEDLPLRAREQLHRSLGASELLDFWLARGDTRFAVRWSGEWLEVEIAAERLPNPKLPTRALVLPQVWQGRSLIGWECDWPQPRSRRSSSYGRAELLLEVPASGGVAKIQYASGR